MLLMLSSFIRTRRQEESSNEKANKHLDKANTRIHSQKPEWIYYYYKSKQRGCGKEGQSKGSD